MKTHAEAKASAPSRAHAMPVPNALAHQAQLRSALLRAGVQPRLEIGAVNDPLEREADAAAERVMRMPEPQTTQETLVQRKASAAPSTQASPQLESSLNSLNSGGTPLDTPSRAFFEPRFGQDFSQVRLHTDPHAAQMAESLNAKAFTLGTDIAFAPNQYSAHTPTGQNLLGHELAHVVQQGGVNGGAVQGEWVQCHAESSVLARVRVEWEHRRLCYQNLEFAKDAVKFVKQELPWGADNKDIDVSRRSYNQSIECVEPMRKKVRLRLEQCVSRENFVRIKAQGAREARCGNCGEQSAVAFVFLLDKGVRPVEWFKFSDIDHAFVVIGRLENSKENDPYDWGPNAVICDPWYEKAYPASELRTHQKDGTPRAVYSRFV